MTWVRTDDSAPHHPKLVRAGAEAAWLWLSGLCYSNAHALDGRLAKDLLPALYVPLAARAAKLAERLVAVGLWHDCGAYYEIHDYVDHQEAALKEVVEARREYERDRKREARRKGHVPDNVPDNVPDKSGTVRDPVPRDTRARPRAPALARPHPVPSRPDPSGDHPQECVISAGGRAPARVREVPPSAEEIQRRFRQLYLERYSSEPYMGGKAVHTLHERLLGTATARGVDPLELLDAAFRRWAAEPLDQIGQSAPYASFAGRFGSLLEAQSGHGLGEQAQLQADQAAALKAGDRERYRSLVAEERRRFGGGNAGSAS